MIETKVVDRVKVSSKWKESIEDKKKNLLDSAKIALEDFAELYADMEMCYFDYEKLSVKNGKIFYYTKLNILCQLEDTKRVDIKLVNEKNILSLIEEETTFCKELLTYDEVKTIFYEFSDEDYLYENYLHESEGVICRNSDGKIGFAVQIGLEPAWVHLSEIPNYYGLIWVLRVPLCLHLPKSKTRLELFVEYGIGLNELEEKSLMYSLTELVKKQYVFFKDGKIELSKKGEEAVLNGNLKRIGYENLSDKEVISNKKAISNNAETIDFSKLNVENKKLVLDSYLKCDFYRANMGEYDLKRLEDPNMGHWELWDENTGEDTQELSLNSRLVARNPISDIQEDSIVGIDFGTKSTVVVYQNESGKVKPMPIGCGDIRKELAAEDFENPTVMQFIDLNHFMKLYNEKKGRPYTLWKDLIVSHAANESMKDTGIRSDEFYSYMYDLKQWAGEGNQKIVIRDKSGKDTLLKTYGEIIQEENTLDPIELYAYYIGLYVNNMNNGIFLDYLLSFPVTYEKNIRNAIIKSFKAGLRKSFPESIQNDSDIMEKFKVEAGASEPAAYAICALQKYGFEPDLGEKVFYGIFDFGGGTADFDFGLWTASENEDVYDYCIEHFGSEGDRYLGGENLLQLLAFEVFKENIELCRKEKITFAKPLEFADIPVELKGYVNDSQEARMNLKFMMEKLRPFWERQEDSSFDTSDFMEFQIGLFDAEGVLKQNLPFEADVEVLEQILKNRIEKGVRQFFNALKGTFSEKHLGKTLNVEQINILLAGNSSKSPILKEIFEKNIEEWNQGISKGKKGEVESYFKLFPTLGSKEAEKLQKEKGIFVKKDLEEPTGKTGVAWGLIEGRKGGRIEIKEEITADSEAKFAYYLGISVRKKFRVKISREEEYNDWIKFIPALQEKFEILYTSLPEAMNGALSEVEDGVLRKRLSLEKYGKEYYIFIRLVGRDTIEYALGTENGNIEESSIQKVTLM